MTSNNIKKDAPAVTGQGAPGTAGNGSGNGSTAGTIVSPDTPGSQAVSVHNSISGTRGKGRPKKNETHIVGMYSQVNTLALKFYDEQLPGVNSVYNSAGLLVQHDPTATPNFIAAIKGTDPKSIQVLAIPHNRDEVTDGIWAVSKVKRHWHVLVRLVDQNKRIRVQQILAGLGIVYRQGLDDELWKEHGVETIGNFPGYVMYLTHETADAIRDAKTKYDVSEIISNLTPEEIQQVRDGYIRVSEKRKLTQEDLIALDREAYDRGYALKTLDDWFSDQPFNVRSAAKIKVITEHYYHGVEARIKEHVEVNRVCIYIQGEPNKGKTYAAEHALLEMGLNVYHVQGGGTGKFDNLTAAHEAILIDDDTCPNLLNMTDGYICQAYRRGRDNPPWTGRLFVVTSNLPFCDWLDASGMHIFKRDKNGDVMRDAYGNPVLTDRGKAHASAMRSRFFLMHIETDEGVSQLIMDGRQEAMRGSIERQQAKVDTAADFRAKFNTIIRGYRPDQSTPDLAPLYAVGGGFRTEDFKADCLCEHAWTILLSKFAHWFWTSKLGGAAWFVEQPEYSGDFPYWVLEQLEYRDDPDWSDYLFCNTVLLERAVRARLPYFHETWFGPSDRNGLVPGLSWGDMYRRYTVDEIMLTVTGAFCGCHGDLPDSLSVPVGYVDM